MSAKLRIDRRHLCHDLARAAYRAVLDQTLGTDRTEQPSAPPAATLRSVPPVSHTDENA